MLYMWIFSSLLKKEISLKMPEVYCAMQIVKIDFIIK